MTSRSHDIQCTGCGNLQEAAEVIGNFCGYPAYCYIFSYGILFPSCSFRKICRSRGRHSHTERSEGQFRLHECLDNFCDNEFLERSPIPPWISCFIVLITPWR